ncbi:MAG: fatty acid desaturase [Planctomycetota bacterium]
MASSWDQAAKGFRAELAASIDTDAVRALHRLSPGRHLLVALRQVLVLAAAVTAYLLWGHHLPVAIIAAIVIGFVVFGFTVLLHEVLHGLVTGARTNRAERILAHVYGVPSGLSPSQFTRWHLDHHDALGTSDADPKRHYLTPKIVKRRVKLLYLTPALFPIYFRAARRAAEGYEPGLKRRIRRERRTAIGFHLAVFAGLGLGLGWVHALWLHAIPAFVVFPVAFTVNRLGQHYDVDPADPAHWGTLLVRSPWTWDLLYLWSNYHLEHHYFPRVPCYRLPALRRELDPFFQARGIRPRTYAGLLVDWFVRNKVPHTSWETPGAPAPARPAHG